MTGLLLRRPDVGESAFGALVKAWQQWLGLGLIFSPIGSRTLGLTRVDSALILTSRHGVHETHSRVFRHWPLLSMRPLLSISTFLGRQPYPNLLQPPRLRHPHAPKRTVSTIRPPSTKPHPPTPSSSSSPPKPKPRRFHHAGTLISGLTTFAAICAFISFIKENVFEIKSVAGESMYPFLNSDFNSKLQKDIVWVNKWRPGEDVRRGMVIAFW